MPTRLAFSCLVYDTWFFVVVVPLQAEGDGEQPSNRGAACFRTETAANRSYGGWGIDKEGELL